MKNVLIIGLGLLGGSYAMGLRDAGYRILAIDVNQNAINYGLEQEIIAEGASTVEPSVVGQADIVIFALYPHLVVDWLKTHQNLLKSGCVITDVCGVKGQLVADIERLYQEKLLREDLYYVGAHPMAGKEVSGIENADPSIFYHANFIITPTDKTNPEALATVERMARELKFQQVSYLSPEEHDKAIAFLSQLTHIIAVSLMNCNDNQEYRAYSGDSFRDLTRIAMINEDLWPTLFMSNKATLLGQIDHFIQEMTDFRSLIEEDNVKGMREKFVTSTSRRKKFIIPKPKETTD